MMAETKTKKNSLHRFLQEMLKEMFQLVVLVEEISCTRFYSRKINQLAFNFIQWVPDFHRERT